MDRRAGFETERDVLLRIVALLLSLADLAHRAATAPPLSRERVFWALRQACGVAAGFVAGEDCDIEGQPPVGDAGFDPVVDPAVAQGLALLLRMLALAVHAMARSLREEPASLRDRDAARGILSGPTGAGCFLPLRLARAPPRLRPAGIDRVGRG